MTKKTSSSHNKFAPESSEPNNDSDESNETGTRLNVYLKDRGIASRRKADQFIIAGRVKVDGVVVKTLGTRVSSDSMVSLDGKRLQKAIPKITYLFHKPDEALTTRALDDNRLNIFQLSGLVKLPKNVQAVGRLDYRSEGLLILTNDGELAYALTHPKFSVPKTYSVLVSETVTADDLEKLRKGVTLDDGFAQPTSVRTSGHEQLGRSKGQWMEISVTEGRNRLIRRMVEAIGHNVVRLVRTSVGKIYLSESLKPGEIVAASAKDQEYFNSVKAKANSTDASKSPISARRKIRIGKGKQITLNDTEYAELAEKRSIESTRLRKQRQDQQSGAPKEGIRQQSEIQSVVVTDPRKTAAHKRISILPKKDKQDVTDTKKSSVIVKRSKPNKVTEQDDLPTSRTKKQPAKVTIKK